MYWSVQIPGEAQPLRVIMGADREYTVQELRVKVLHGSLTKNAAVVRIPANRLGATRLKPGQAVPVSCTLTTQARSHAMTWEGRAAAGGQGALASSRAVVQSRARSGRGKPMGKRVVERNRTANGALFVECADINPEAMRWLRSWLLSGRIRALRRRRSVCGSVPLDDPLALAQSSSAPAVYQADRRRRSRLFQHPRCVRGSDKAAVRARFRNVSGSMSFGKWENVCTR